MADAVAASKQAQGFTAALGHQVGKAQYEWVAPRFRHRRRRRCAPPREPAEHGMGGRVASPVVIDRSANRARERWLRLGLARRGRREQIATT